MCITVYAIIDGLKRNNFTFIKGKFSLTCLVLCPLTDLQSNPGTTHLPPAVSAALTSLSWGGLKHWDSWVSSIFVRRMSHDHLRCIHSYTEYPQDCSSYLRVSCLPSGQLHTLPISCLNFVFS